MKLNGRYFGSYAFLNFFFFYYFLLFLFFFFKYFLSNSRSELIRSLAPLRLHVAEHSDAIVLSAKKLEGLSQSVNFFM